MRVHNGEETWPDARLRRRHVALTSTPGLQYLKVAGSPQTSRCVQPPYVKPLKKVSLPPVIPPPIFSLLARPRSPISRFTRGDHERPGADQHGRGNVSFLRA